ncbi:aldose 1-epimerase [Fulvimonas sp. R45]|uniref:aldose 1-epimerase n=1 Tax=Fulvimonas sp. R45 TaxID=3045937 RepID=UPI00265F9250|nr:aldose 1-epimerase [Fulvimonas sp. R45]MDO1527604.1 aldose 1-epimerase [Fulvimonas sp. R45]
MLHLTHGRLRARILPEAGGALTGFDYRKGADRVPLMRPFEPSATFRGKEPDPNQLACYPLLPWSNRIAHGGFVVDGRRVTLEANRDDDPYPIHGSGWQRAWQVLSCNGREARLVLDERAKDAYAYRANLHYLLHADALEVMLEVTNTGEHTLPFGLGLHPFFPRHRDTTLRAPAARVWLNDGRSPLPVECVDVPPAWNFDNARPLPDGLNHGFHAWSGDAVIGWPAHGLRLQVAADVDAFVLYTPAGEDFFCFEPVDHAINAVHLPGGAAANGMTLLAPRSGLARRFAFRVLDEAAHPLPGT